MANVALVEKTSSRTDYIRHFENKFEFDRYQLCSDPSKKKILKRDVILILIRMSTNGLFLLDQKHYNILLKKERLQNIVVGYWTISFCL